MAVNARGSFELPKPSPHMRGQQYGKIINIDPARSSKGSTG